MSHSSRFHMKNTAATMLWLTALAATGLAACGTVTSPQAGRTAEHSIEATVTDTDAAAPTTEPPTPIPPGYITDLGSVSADTASIPSNQPLITYRPLDAQGRATGVIAQLTTDSRALARSWGRGNNPSNQRKNLSDIKPSGWPMHNPEVTVTDQDGASYHGYFWNRSHLLADSLGGRISADNIITGTRMQNVGMNNNAQPEGMAYTETLARDYLDNPDNAYCDLYYAVTPNYQNDAELIPRTVTVDIQSCDKKIDQSVLIHNVMPGYTINYYDGSITRNAVTLKSNN